MKRMYVTLAVILLAFVWALSALSQMTSATDQKQISPPTHQRQPFDRMKRRMELRAEMHRRMMEKLMNGAGPDQDMFKDMEDDFEEAMKDSFSNFDSFSSDFSTTSNYQSEWKESKTGRTLIITPKDKDQKLNIDVSATAITVKGETKTQNQNTSFSSAFTNSFPVPDDCDGTKVKLNSADGKILVELPFKSAKSVATPQKEVAPPKEERRPLPPSEGDVEI